jgi:hypothetical protein
MDDQSAKPVELPPAGLADQIARTVDRDKTLPPVLDKADRLYAPFTPGGYPLVARTHAASSPVTSVSPTRQTALGCVGFLRSVEELTRGSADVYGAPRVFDLFTLLAITLFFALLFALLGYIAPAFEASADLVTVVISVYVTFVALGQATLFKSQNPRLASIVAGPIAFFLVGLVLWLYSGNTSRSDQVIFLVFASLLVGGFTGYLAGGIAAGVFLLADNFRKYFLATNNESHDTAFDELE